MLITLLMAFFWGVFWAAFLQLTRIGRFLALKRTWITVVIGIGIDLLIAIPLVPFNYTLRIFFVIAASSIGIIARSLINELTELTEEIDVIKDPAGQ